MNRNLELERLHSLLARVQMRAALPRDKPPPAAPISLSFTLAPAADPSAVSPVSAEPELTVEEAVIEAVILEPKSAPSDVPFVAHASEPAVAGAGEQASKPAFELRGIDLEVEMDPFQEPAIEVQRRDVTAAGGISSRERIVAAVNVDDSASTEAAEEALEYDFESQDLVAIDLTIAPPDSELDLIPDSEPQRSPLESGRHRASNADSTGVHARGLLRFEDDAPDEHEQDALADQGAAEDLEARELDLPPAIAPGEFTADLPRPGSSVPPPDTMPPADPSTLPYAYGMRLPDVVPSRATQLSEGTPREAVTMERVRSPLPEGTTVAAMVVRAPFAPATLGDLLDATLEL